MGWIEETRLQGWEGEEKDQKEWNQDFGGLGWNEMNEWNDELVNLGLDVESEGSEFRKQLADWAEKEASKLGQGASETMEASKLGHGASETREVSQLGQGASKTREASKLGQGASETREVSQLGQGASETREVSQLGQGASETREASKLGQVASETREVSQLEPEASPEASKTAKIKRRKYTKRSKPNGRKEENQNGQLVELGGEYFSNLESGFQVQGSRFLRHQDFNYGNLIAVPAPIFVMFGFPTGAQYKN